MDPREHPNNTEESSSTNPDGGNNENSRRNPTASDRPHITNSSRTNNMNASTISARRSSSVEAPINLNTNFDPRSATSAASVVESISGASTSVSTLGPSTSASSGTGISCPTSDGGISTSPSDASTGGSTIGTCSSISLFVAGSNASLFGATTRAFPTITSESFLGAGSRAPAFAGGTSTATSGIRNRRNRHSISALENINSPEFDYFTRPRQSPYDRSPIMRANNDGAPVRPFQTQRSIYTPLRIPYNQLPQRVVQPPPNDDASRVSATNNVVNDVARVQSPAPPPDAEDENKDIEPGPSSTS